MNINEKFLLKILENVEFVHCNPSKGEYLFFSYKDMEIQIPYSFPSTNINIKFIYHTDIINNHIINFLIDSPNEIKDFMRLVYQKYENIHNNQLPSLPKKVLDIFDDMLMHPLDKDYPYSYTSTPNSPYIEEKNKTSGCSIFLYETIFPDGKVKKFNPLEPIVIPCYYSNGDENSEDIPYYKVIPAYLAHEYPVLSNIVKLNNIVNDTSELSNILYSLGGELGPEINSLILEADLEINSKAKKSKPKL
jgi:hypothetical protein